MLSFIKILEKNSLPSCRCYHSFFGWCSTNIANFWLDCLFKLGSWLDQNITFSMFTNLQESSASLPIRQLVKTINMAELIVIMNFKKVIKTYNFTIYNIVKVNISNKIVNWYLKYYLLTLSQYWELCL